jgi:hypothetical protein
MTATLPENQCPFMVISRSFLLITRIVSDKRHRKNQNTLFMFNNYFFENRTVYKVM